MSRKFSRLATLVSLNLILLFLVFINSLTMAFAHEGREVSSGKYYLRVGFLKEPAYQGLENGLELLVCKGNRCQSKGDGTYSNGIEGLFDSLKAEVIFGSQKMDLRLASVPRNPGRYDGFFIPTRPGDYTFRIYGIIEGEKVDESFTSSSNTFDSVQSLAVAQFPDKPGFNPAAPTANPAPTANSVPTSATQAATIPTATPSATVNSAQSELQNLRDRLNEQQQLVKELKANSDTATFLAVGGLIVGLIGLILAGVVIWRQNSKSKMVREAEGG